MLDCELLSRTCGVLGGGELESGEDIVTEKDDSAMNSLEVGEFSDGQYDGVKRPGPRSSLVCSFQTSMRPDEEL